MNRNKIVDTLLFLILLLAPSLAFAEFYKYRDENGALIYTDDLAKVPEDQRPKVSTYQEAEDLLTPVEKYKKRQQEAAARGQSEGVKPKKKKRNLSSPKRTELEKNRTALLQEKAELVNKQQALSKFNYRRADYIQIKVHKKKIAKLNKRIQAYEKRRQEFELEVAKYNP